MTTAERLTQLRRLAGGISQRRASQLCGVSPSYFQHLEAGTRSPGGEVLRSIAVTFGASLDWLLMGTGAEPSTESVQAAVGRRGDESGGGGAVEHGGGSSCAL